MSFNAVIIIGRDVCNVSVCAIFTGSHGPEVIMTDDSAAEKAAVGVVFPKATQLLCVYHVADAMWRWLWSKQNQIQLEDRKTCMEFFRALIHAKCRKDFLNK